MELKSEVSVKNIPVITKDVTQKPDPEASLSTAPVQELDASVAGVEGCMTLSVVNGLTYLFLFAVAGYAFAIAIMAPAGNNDYSASFSLHIYLCVTGYVILMAPSIVLFYPFSYCDVSLKSRSGRVIQGGMQVVGSVLALTGGVIKIADSTPKTINPFHVITGWIAIGLTFLSLVGGILQVKLSHKEIAARFKELHTNLILLIIFLAFLSLYFAFIDQHHRDNFFQHEKDLFIASLIVTTLAMTGILISTVYIKFQQVLLWKENKKKQNSGQLH